MGGKGDDYMEGGSGSDTYVFNKGDGQDTIYADNEDTEDKEGKREGMVGKEEKVDSSERQWEGSGV